MEPPAQSSEMNSLGDRAGLPSLERRLAWRG